MSGQNGRPAPMLFWSNSGNFPAGVNPWNGQPLTLQPAGTYFLPNTKPASEEFNWLFGNMTLTSLSFEQWAGCHPALNWSAQLVTSSLINNTPGPVMNAQFSPVNKQWLLASYNVVTGAYTPRVFTAYDYGQDVANGWATLATTGITDASGIVAMAVCEDDVAGQYWLSFIRLTSNDLKTYFYTGGAWTLKNTLTTMASNGGVEQVFYNNVIVVAAAGVGVSWNYSSNDGTSWTNAFSTITPTQPSGAGQRWLLKANSSIVLGFATKTASPYSYVSSPDGVTWSATAATFLGASDKPQGLAWGADSSGPCWMLVTQNGSAIPKFWRSADGLNWSAISSTLLATTAVTDLAACGSLWVATLADGSHQTAMFSIDGGITWFESSMDFSSGVGARIWSSNQNFLTFNSSWFRFSGIAGLPPTAL